jgi:hypothetical protein
MAMLSRLTRYANNIIKNSDVLTRYKWDNSSQQWQKIGDVVDAVGSGRKQLYEGKEYDYVFDVDIQDGVPPLKLPFNVTGAFSPSGVEHISYISQRTLIPRHRDFFKPTSFL